MTLSRLWALVAVIALVAVGVFLLYAVGSGTGFVPISLPSTWSPFMLAGALCLLAAAYAGVLLVRTTGGQSRRSHSSVIWLGIAMVLLAPFLPFPVGCNLQTVFNTSHASLGCPASPYGSWSTVWPNVLILDLGLILTGLCLAERRSDGSPLAGLGMGSIMSGIVLIAFGSSFSGITACTAIGCGTLTGGAWWSLFWPNVLAESLGAILIVVGCVTVFLAWHRSVSAKPAALSRASETASSLKPAF
jgi:hypothetical protein